MDFDCKTEELSSHEVWMYERKRMQNMKTLLAVCAPAVMICFLFFVNVIHLGPKPLRAPAISEMKLGELVDDDSNPRYWYSTIAPKKQGRMVAKQ